MEEGVLSSKPVTEVLKHVPRVALFTDKQSSEAEAKHKALMLEKYNKAGAIPAFYVIDAQGEVKSSLLGSSDQEGFLKFLAQGGLETGKAEGGGALRWVLLGLLLAFVVWQVKPDPPPKPKADPPA